MWLSSLIIEIVKDPHFSYTNPGTLKRHSALKLNVQHYNPTAIYPRVAFYHILPTISLRDIPIPTMTRQSSPCHIGIAFYTYPTSVTQCQWVLVLSENPLFEGKVWCNTVIETVNGWGAHWAPCDWSPAAFNPTALFSGVVYVAQASAPMNSIKAVIASENRCSELDRFKVHGSGDISWGTEKYIILALWRLSFREERYICLHVFDLAGLANQIEFCLAVLRDSQQTIAGKSYPVVSFSGGVSFGRFIS